MLAEIDTLMSARLNTPDGRRLEQLAGLVEAYEIKHFPIFHCDTVGTTGLDPSN